VSHSTEGEIGCKSDRSPGKNGPASMNLVGLHILKKHFPGAWLSAGNLLVQHR